MFLSLVFIAVSSLRNFNASDNFSLAIKFDNSSKLALCGFGGNAGNIDSSIFRNRKLICLPCFARLTHIFNPSNEFII